ncbi:Gfo/Idh/MocA family protein [Verrucomicrobiota bacterium]
MRKIKEINRRQFLGSTATAAALAALPGRVLGGTPRITPNNKITIAFIGTGTMGTRHLIRSLKCPELQIVSVCDPNKSSTDYLEWIEYGLRKTIREFLGDPSWGEGDNGCRAGREQALQIVNRYYAKTRKKDEYRGCTAYADFRELLEKEKDLDAVYIMTPEHLHATIAIAAMKKGIHVITHKTLSNVFHEVGLAADTARKSGVISHMLGSYDFQDRFFLKSWLQDGTIGTLREIHLWTNRPVWPQGMEKPIETPSAPNGLDWNLWLGPTQHRPYHPMYTHTLFRAWYDFGSGALGDMGSYALYQLYKMFDFGVPTKIEARRTVTRKIQGFHTVQQSRNDSFPHASTVRFDFPANAELPPVSLYWYEAGLKPPRPVELEEGRQLQKEGVLFVGDKGKIMAGFRGRSPRLIPESRMKNCKRPDVIIPKFKGSEWGKWISAIQKNEPSDGDFAHIQPMAETICLGTIAQRLGASLDWDADKKQFTNAPEANKLLYRKYRKGWEL